MTGPRAFRSRPLLLYTPRLTPTSQGGVLTPPRHVEDAAPYKDGPKSSYTYTRPRRPEGRPPYNFPFTPCKGRACPARNLPAACR